MPFLTLPNELTLEISAYLSLHDLNSLQQTCHYFHARLSSCLVSTLLQTRPVDAAMRLIYSAASDPGHSKLLYLLSRGVHEIPGDRYILLDACYESAEIYTRLLDAGLEPNSLVNTQTNCLQRPLNRAAARGRVDIVKLLLARDDVDINSTDGGGISPMCAAMYSNQADVVRVFLADPRLDITRNGQTCMGFHMAAGRGQQGVVRVMLEHGRFDVNLRDYNNYTVFARAVSNGHTRIVQMLMRDERVDINLPQSSGITPIMLAVHRGHADIVGLPMVDYRIDMDARASDGSTLIFPAARGGCVPILRRLLADSRVKLDVRDNLWQTVLHAVAQEGVEGAGRILLKDERVEINPVNDLRRTPLFHTIDACNGVIVKLFLEDERVDVFHVDNLGFTPMTFAADTERRGIISLMAQHRRFKGHNGATNTETTRAKVVACSQNPRLLARSQPGAL